MKNTIILFILLLFNYTVAFSQDKYHRMRETMIKDQIERRGVSNKAVLKALREVPREKFVPTELRDSAYQDRPLPIGHMQTISQPYIVAYMTESLQLKKNDRVLEIGTGSGYQAAILSKIVKEVYSIEIVPALGERAKELLEKLGYDNIKVKIGDGYIGWKKYAPFDAIILTAAPPKVPQPLIEQLKEGGRLVAPVGTFFQELVLLTKVKGKINKVSLIPVRFVPMTGISQEKQ